MAGVWIVPASQHLPAPGREALASRVGASFGVAARAAPAPLDVQCVYDPSRRQYNATALLAQVVTLAGESGEKVIAVVDVDLYIPVLSFVFGQALLDGGAGVVSTHRLANEFYGLRRDETLLRERLDKEVLHELGHMFGLYHCHQFECVMRASTYVEEIDLKRTAFCAGCQSVLRSRAAAASG